MAVFGSWQRPLALSVTAVCALAGGLSTTAPSKAEAHDLYRAKVTVVNHTPRNLYLEGNSTWVQSQGFAERVFSGGYDCFASAYRPPARLAPNEEALVVANAFSSEGMRLSIRYRNRGMMYRDRNNSASYVQINGHVGQGSPLSYMRTTNKGQLGSYVFARHSDGQKQHKTAARVVIYDAS